MKSLDIILGDFPLLPVPESLEIRLTQWLESLGINESYQEDAGPGSSGKSAEER